MSLFAMLLLAQLNLNTQRTQVINPSWDGGALLNVNCVNCSGGGGGSIDGGLITVIQGPGADGGNGWIVHGDEKIGTPIVDGDDALAVQSVINGYSTAGGGTYETVKVTPSGALTVETTQSSFPWLVAGADGGAVDVRTELSGPGSVEPFGRVHTGGLDQQIHISFYENGGWGISNTYTGAFGVQGSAAWNGYGRLYTTGAGQLDGGAVETGAKGITTAVLLDRGGSEFFANFTAAFTTPVVAESFSRIGVWDDSNGYFIGYDGTTFKACSRFDTTDTCTAKASWNVDALTGAAGSRFTRAGTPEAIDLTKLNVYRIRFAVNGMASTFFEVLSPDNQWVTFHVLRPQNADSTPTVKKPNLPMRVQVSKSTPNTTPVSILTTSWAGGTTVSDTAVKLRGDTLAGDGVNYATAAVDGNGRLSVDTGFQATNGLAVVGDALMVQPRIRNSLMRSASTVYCGYPAGGPQAIYDGTSLRAGYCVYNGSGSTIYLGGDYNVTAADGFPIPHGTYFCDEARDQVVTCTSSAAGLLTVRMLYY